MARTDLPYLEYRLKELDSEWDNLQRIKVTPENRESLKIQMTALKRHIEFVEHQIRYQKSVTIPKPTLRSKARK